MRLLMLKPVVAASVLIATLFAASVSLSAEFKELTGDPPPLEPGHSEHLKGLYERAVAGNPIAQTELGIAYLRGNEVPVHLGKAIHWLRQAHESDATDRVFDELHCALIQTGDAKLMAEGGAAIAARRDAFGEIERRIERSKVYRFGIGVPQDQQRADQLIAEVGDLLRDDGLVRRGWRRVANQLKAHLISSRCVGSDTDTARRIDDAAKDLTDETAEPVLDWRRDGLLPTPPRNVR